MKCNKLLCYYLGVISALNITVILEAKSRELHKLRSLNCISVKHV